MLRRACADEREGRSESCLCCISLSAAAANLFPHAATSAFSRQKYHAPTHSSLRVHMATPDEDSGNIDASGKLKRRRHGIIMLAVAAAAYIGLIIPPHLDRRWIIASAAPCVAGIFTIVQSQQVTTPTAALHIPSPFPSNTPFLPTRAADSPLRYWARRRRAAA